MIRGIGAQLVWSLKLDVRDRLAHLLRLLFVGLLLLSVTVAWLTSLSVGAPGLYLFKAICFLNVMLILLAGASFFATTVTEEKEANSLALLKLANMGPLSILLGKFASRLIGATMLLLVQFPFTLLAITLGGCTVGQVIAAYVALIAFLFLVATIALICSVRSSTSGTAAAVTGLLVLLILLVPTIVASVVSTAPQPTTGIMKVVEQAGEFVGEVSIFQRLSTINSTGFAESPFSRQVLTHLGASFLFFLFAWLIFEPSTRNASGPIRQTGVLSSTNPLRIFGVGRSWNQPFVWKDFYFVTGGKTFFIVKFVSFGLMSVGILWFAGRIDGGGTIAIIMISIVALEAAIYSARVFFDEVRWNSLASITLTPHSTRSIAGGKVLGCALGLIPGLFWLIIGIICAPESSSSIILHPNSGYLVIQYLTFLHLSALLSLHVRWGAMPLAFVITFAASACCPVLWIATVFAGNMSTENRLAGFVGASIGMVVYWLVILFPIECEISARLRRIAGR